MGRIKLTRIKVLMRKVSYWQGFSFLFKGSHYKKLEEGRRSKKKWHEYSIYNYENNVKK